MLANEVETIKNHCINFLNYYCNGGGSHFCQQTDLMFDAYWKRANPEKKVFKGSIREDSVTHKMGDVVVVASCREEALSLLVKEINDATIHCFDIEEVDDKDSAIIISPTRSRWDNDK